jgi:Rrf2 family protein
MLNFSVAANIAVHSLVYLAGLDRATTVSATQIAEKIAVSPSHLSKVLQELARQGLVRSTRGARGGFSLAVDLRELTLLKIIRAVDPPPKPDHCLLGEQLCHGVECRLKELREKVYLLVEEELSSTSLADFAPKPKDGPDDKCYLSG